LLASEYLTPFFNFLDILFYFIFIYYYFSGTDNPGQRDSRREGGDTGTRAAQYYRGTYPGHHSAKGD
jgi:hypothetical protein